MRGRRRAWRCLSGRLRQGLVTLWRVGSASFMRLMSRGPEPEAARTCCPMGRAPSSQSRAYHIAARHQWTRPSTCGGREWFWAEVRDGTGPERGGGCALRGDQRWPKCREGQAHVRVPPGKGHLVGVARPAERRQVNRVVGAHMRPLLAAPTRGIATGSRASQPPSDRRR